MSLRAKLLFDSAGAGALVGARGAVQLERSLLFASGPIAVDLVAFEEGGGVQVLHGQVLDSQAERPVAGARVALGAHGESVETDHFGEFSVSTLEPLGEQVLRIVTDDLQLDCRVPAVTGKEEVCR